MERQGIIVAEEHLRWLFGSLDQDEQLYLAPADAPKFEVRVSTLEEALARVRDWQGRGVFCSTGTFRPNTARQRENLLSIPTLLLDADLKDLIMRDEGLAEEEAERRVRTCSETDLQKLAARHREEFLAVLARAGLAPSSLAFTGGGHQAQLLLDFLEQREISRIVNIHKALVQKLNDLAGWKLCDTQVVDAGTRYFRLPGTANVKSDPPRLACIIQNSGPTYTLEQLEGVVGVQKKREQAAPDREGSESEDRAVLEVAQILLRYWQRGKRHELALSLSGFLAKGGWSWERVKACLILIATHAKDEELRGRLKDIETTFARLAKGEEVKGYTALRRILIAEDMSRLEEAAGAGEIPLSKGPTEKWPVLADDALYGLAGDMVRAIAPYTEADPVAILVNILVMFGNVIAANAHFLVEFTKHFPRFFVALVGRTAKGRKGLSMSTPRHMFGQVDEDWVTDCISSGLSSGEGLIYQVRDQRTARTKDGDEVIVDEGVQDKRLLLVEEEFASPLKVMARQGNTLSAVIRQAWDTGNLRSLTKNNPIRATGAHVSIIAHVAKDELLRLLTETEQGNGFANRFTWFLVKRSKVISRPKGVPQETLLPFVKKLQQAVTLARRVEAMDRDQEAEALWGRVYPDLSEERPGLFGAIIARAEAQVMRFACGYALLNSSAVVKVEHLKAALALWDYSEESARLTFGDALGDPIADAIYAALSRHPEGLTRTDISYLFGRNRKAEEIERALGALLAAGRARRAEEPSGGRPAERWVACTKETKNTK